jgi:hypothetical protein
MGERLDKGTILFLVILLTNRNRFYFKEPILIKKSLKVGIVKAFYNL